MWAAFAILGAGLVACGGADRTAPRVANSPPPSACIADGLGPLRDARRIDTPCLERQRSCKAECAGGDAMACMEHGYAQQRAESHADADRTFGRACQLGLAIGCTNHAAALWLSNQPAPAADVLCASRLFERACDSREQFGCGMKGRMLADRARTAEEKEAARRFFDKTCTDLGAMSCRMYAHHLELGQLGTFDPATVKALMLRACETGDDEACGRDSAAGSFH